MSKTVRINGKRLVTIVSMDGSDTAISTKDNEMDIRARAAVRSAIERAEICKKPVAKYDRASKRAYIVTADGEKIYV